MNTITNEDGAKLIASFGKEACAAMEKLQSDIIHTLHDKDVSNVDVTDMTHSLHIGVARLIAEAMASIADQEKEEDKAFFIATSTLMSLLAALQAQQSVKSAYDLLPPFLKEVDGNIAQKGAVFVATDSLKKRRSDLGGLVDAMIGLYMYHYTRELMK